MTYSKARCSREAKSHGTTHDLIVPDIKLDDRSVCYMWSALLVKAYGRVSHPCSVSWDFFSCHSMLSHAHWLQVLVMVPKNYKKEILEWYYII